MKLISWNVRGCNSQLKKRLFKWKIQIEKPTILFLQETKCSSEDLAIFGRKFWRGEETVAIDASGAAGGLGLLWNPNLVSITNLVGSRNMISTCFHIIGTAVRGVITNVYGPFQVAQKPAFLEELTTLRGWVGSNHWIISGDFNLIRTLEEKKQGI